MGEGNSSKFEANFNRSVKVEFTDHRITSNAGVLILREADHQLQLVSTIVSSMHDPRRQDLIRYEFGDLLRERLFALALGYSAQDDVDRLAHDPAFRLAVWNRAGDGVLDERLASQPTQSRLLGMIANDRRNINSLREGLFECVERHIMSTDTDRPVMHGTIDLDSFPIEVHGQQQGSQYNGYYRRTAYHPLVASFSVAGDYDSSRVGTRLGNGFIHAILRQGSVHTSKGAVRFIGNVIKKAKKLARFVDFRIDAGYTIGEVMDTLSSQKVKFAGRLRGNAKLDELAAEHVKRIPGRPPMEGYEYLVDRGDYQVDTWRYAQRLILVVVDKPDPVSGQLDLMPHYFFLVTNWDCSQRTAEQLLAHYRPRGTFEDRLGEFNQVIGVQLSSQPFAENEATMLLAMLAYNLANVVRNEHEDVNGSCMDRGRFQNQVLKDGGQVVKHSRRLIVRVARSVQDFWTRLSDRISSWKLPDRLQLKVGPNRSQLRPPPKHSHLVEVLLS